MASEVDICNLALAHVADAANVSSIDPPDTSAQAGHCARFYPIARDSLQEMHSWGFCTRRAQLALSTITSNQWSYVYIAPDGVLNFLAVIDPNAADDLSTAVPQYGLLPQVTNSQVGVYTPQPYVVESDANGNQLVYTNQENALLRYTTSVTDTTKFSPLFVETLALWLGSKLAGPVVKGETGREVAAQLRQETFDMLHRAIQSDANQRRLNPAQGAAWMVNR